jgi:hypothetical protein
MTSRDLLARLTLAISAVAVPLTACGGETVDSGPATAGTGGSSAAGSGGTTSGAGTGGSAGTGVAGTSAAGGTSGTGGSGGTGVGAMGGTGGSGGTGVGAMGGTGGAGGTGGTAGTAGSGGTGIGGSGPTCERPLPEKGSQGFGDACRVAADCNEGNNQFNECLRPDEPICAGGGGAPEPPQCETDAACNEGPAVPPAAQVCQTTETGYRYCSAKCTSDAVCGASQRCDVQTGHCEGRPCAAPGEICPEESFCGEKGKCVYKTCSASRPCPFGDVCNAQTFVCEPTVCAPNDPSSCPDTFSCQIPATQGPAICVRKSCACDTECGAKGYCLGGTCYEDAGTCTGQIACGRPLLLDDGARVARLVRGLGSADGWS